MAQVVSELGDWLYSVAVYSLLLDLTGTAKSVAMAVVLQVLPQFFIGPMAGVLNDRVRRKRVMIAADLARAGIVLCMVLVRNLQMVPFLYVLLFAETVMWAFFEPGRTAIIPVLTGDEADTAAANGLSSITWSFNLAIGAAAGGVIAVLLGRNAVFALNAASFLLSAALVSRIRVRETHADRHTDFRARDLFDFTPVLEGIRYVRADHCLLATLLVKAGQGFLGAHWVILPILGERVFPVAPQVLGPNRAGMLGMSLLFGARGVGALLGPLIGGYWAGDDRRRLRLGIFFGFLAIAAGYLMLSGATTVWQAIATVILAHAGGSIVWVFSTTLLHFQTEDRFRGRVFSADFGFLTLAMSVVTAIGGAAVDWGVSVRAVAFCTGALAVIPAALWWSAQRLWAEAAKVP
jgi:predicted MFS family arabinose efflux permease